MNTPSLEIIAVLGLAVLALLFLGYQLDDMHRRVKELEFLDKQDMEKIFSVFDRQSRLEDEMIIIMDNMKTIENKFDVWFYSLPEGKEKLMQEVIEEIPIRKRGRPKKVVNGKNDNP